ncbi:MAG: site-2 protease family protein [Bacillota bacterium]
MGGFFDLRSIILSLPGLLIALSFHEYAHARAATALGDDTPRLAGRLTLDPLAHLDPLGTLMILLGGFGWARPVQFNPVRLRGNMRRSSMLVALAGPAMNLVLAFVLYTGYDLALRFVPGGFPGDVSQIIVSAAYLNVILAVFNLLPIPPLDGSWVLQAFLPWQARRKLEGLQRGGPTLLILLVVTGAVSFVLSPVVGVVHLVITWAAGIIAGL